MTLLFELVRLSYIHVHGEIIHEPGLMKGEGCLELPALTTVSPSVQL